MSDELKRDVIDGKIIDWSKLSQKKLLEMKNTYQQKEKELLEKINARLSEDKER